VSNSEFSTFHRLAKWNWISGKLLGRLWELGRVNSGLIGVCAHVGAHGPTMQNSPKLPQPSQAEVFHVFASQPWPRQPCKTLFALGVFTHGRPPNRTERLARHDPGPQPNTRLDIRMARNREPIRDQDRPLFQRAFHDCCKIAFSELSGGRSRARVFSAHATVDNSIAGAWPQPFLSSSTVSRR
jgi:hypothetical protein